MEVSQDAQISYDPETKGFDLSAGKTWIYPENYPVRDYQFNIVQASLYSNTLVCLPTGLGKTFIAAVVMYNFWRWYPCGKVVFLAPTRPLVAQQISACHNIMGIPSKETIELTGAVSQKQREIAWSKKRVVFATPQVFHNDLEKNVVPGNLVKCVVIDEAHKALGKHSYCECIRILYEKNQYFRVLALSATPGNKLDNVHEVVQNLHIAHIELKDETSSDIIPYINQRKIDVILVPLSNELADYKERYIYIMDRHVKVLLQCNVLRGHTANISKGRVFHILREFQKKSNKSGNYGLIMKTLNILMTMYHAYELMIRDGLRAFYKFYQNHSDKFWMNEEIHLQNLLEDINIYLGPFPDVKSSCEEIIPDVPQNLVFGHTKFEKLKELLLQHFRNSQGKQDDTRAIVFVEYRDIVNEIYILLLQCRPLIKPQMFVGQAGQKQKQQIKALENFRSNRVNVLISTSIGEEGLDVGEVDLIICFDISQHSPTRLVQRMGRTGRKRDGHIIILVTDGKEHETLRSTMARRDSLNNRILNTSNISSSLYQNNPRMIPDIFKPECLKMHISIQPPSSTPMCKNKKENSKDNKRKNIRKKTITTDINLETQRNKNKCSMMKFLKNDKEEERKNNILKTNSDTTQNLTVRNTINPSDVKILSCDNDAVDFLTLCTLRNSEKEVSTQEKRIASQLIYVPEFSVPNNFFHFLIPHVNILNCLETLNDVIPLQCEKINKNNEKDSVNDSDNDNLYINNDKYEIVSTINEISNKSNAAESKFEDLLDDSSDSNTSTIEGVEEKIRRNSKIHSISEAVTSLKQDVGADDFKLMVNAVDLQNLDAGTFEDILNETSDSEGTVQNENFRQIEVEDIAISSDMNFKVCTNTLKVNDNIKSYGTHLQETMNVIDTVPLTLQTEYNNELHYTNLNESKNRSLFTVTQAINEIARLNRKSNMSQIVDDSEDDMFQDENFQVETFKPKIEHSIESKKSNDVMNLDKSTHSNNRNRAISLELKIEECDWEDDFEISVKPEQNCVKLDVFKDENKELPIKDNIEVQSTDSEGWISVEKSFDTSKKNRSNISIAKKLSRVKNNWSSTGSRDMKKKEDFESDPSMNKENKNIERERSHFFNTTRDDSDKCKSPQKIANRFNIANVRKHNRARKSKKVRNEFIDDEAEVSTSDGGTVTDESSGVDEDLEDFVSYTQNVHDTSEMHVHYLKTVRSPIRNGGFLFKQPRALDTSIEVYSQPVTQAHESYINDSFCVTGDNEEECMITRIEELSELELAEQELERRKRKRNRGEKFGSSTRKKKRIKKKNIINYCTSSEDETEKLREEIKDQSLLLAQSCQKN
ncbi:FA complementation group M [Calliopsis andreniformis]|uniref:FA complementation group M n=1 Tax=Calliopsis andreniformis TaxID=337506 RepID=UPI003FCD942A